MTDQIGLHTYQYDPVYQLIQAVHPNIPTEQFNYDSVGNRQDAVFNEVDGFQVNTTYTFDYENRLTRIQYTGMDAQYKYDPFGRRIEKNVNGQITRYVYDGDNILTEYDGSNNIKNKYVFSLAIDDPLSVEQAGSVYYYHKDGLGSVTELTNAAGSVVKTYRYNSFGEIYAQTGSLIQPFTFTGREYDPESGLYYYRARYYDPSAGIFIGKDPIGFDSGGVNYYAYVENDPVNWSDPDGLRKSWNPPILSPSRITPLPGQNVGQFYYPYLPKPPNNEIRICKPCVPIFHTSVYWSCVGNQIGQNIHLYSLFFGGMALPSGFTQVGGAISAIALSNFIGYTCHNIATYCD